MRLATTLWMLAVAVNGFAQNQETRKYPVDPATLSKKLVSPYNTEKEKVTSIFRWITENIAYHRPDNRQRKKKAIVDLQWQTEDEGELPSLTERVAAKVIRDGRAVCEGYARLFQSLCEHAGIRSQIITGYARTKWNGPDDAFRSNHTWNAVCIDGAWYLLDVTWASGFIARSSGEFIRYFDEYYFLSEPEKFIEHHYPDDLRWALMEDLPTIPEFRRTPFRQKSFNKYSITSFFPSRGVIETMVGDTIQLELETLAAARNLNIASDSLWEPDCLPQTISHAFVQPEATRNSEKVYYRFPVNSENVQWLYVMYNNDAVLRYRLNVKKPAMTSATPR